MSVDSPAEGATLAGRYRLDAVIGRGGMALVYRGFDLQLERPVAIKIFQPGSDDAVRWGSEVRLLSLLSHPHLVTLHDAHLESGGSVDPSYLVMEYVSGTNLQQHLAHAGPSAALARSILEQVGEALAAVHARGIVHRDVKPGNILLEPSERTPDLVKAKLADFGIAHLLGSERVTQTGTTIGTAAYISPEQLRGAPASPASDVYSLGLVALECVSGVPAFPGTMTETLAARLTRDPELLGGLDDDWTALLGAMISRDPAVRPSAIDAAMKARVLPDSASGAARFPREAVTQPLMPPTLPLPGNPAAAATPVGATEPAARAALAVASTSAFPAPRRSSARGRGIPIWIAGGAAVLVAAGIVAAALSGHPAASTRVPPTTPVPTSTVAVAPPSPTVAPIPPGSGNGKGNGHGKGNGNGKNG